MQDYCNVLHRQVDDWLSRLDSEHRFTSVFFGGGTPGLFVEEYQPLLRRLEGVLTNDAEITLEANPANVNEDRLKAWRDIGFNRISIGVQTFSDNGLRALTRDHSGEDAVNAIKLAAKIFSRVNGDLIYGWLGQTKDIWQSDLHRMIDCGVGHMSLYALTYEGQTPFARAERRGAIVSASDAKLAEYYEMARDVLAQNGYVHDEISNWARPGFSCRHNWLYWSGRPYVGIGAGAHGFVPDSTQIGRRYSYTGDLRRFLREAASGLPPEIVEDDRTIATWLLEYVGCGLRSSRGIDEMQILARGYVLKPTPNLLQGLASGVVRREHGRIRLDPAEWFRETAWSLEIAESFV